MDALSWLSNVLLKKPLPKSSIDTEKAGITEKGGGEKA